MTGRTPGSGDDISEIDPIHDGRHVLRNLPMERESMPYIVALPEQGIAAAIYTWVDKDSMAGALFGIFGPAVGGQPVIAKIDEVRMPVEQNFDQWQVGPVQLAQGLDFKHADIVAVCDQGRMELSFEAIHPPYAYSAHPRGCPQQLATDRIEQSGRLRGFVEINGQRYAVDSTGARDHSWGTRDWNYAQHWKWLHAQNRDVAVHFWDIDMAGRKELRGYVYRDGLMAQVRSVEIDWQADARCRQEQIQVRILDTANRTTTVHGKYFGHFEFPPSPTCTLIEGAMACEIDGVPSTGWTEFMWPTAYLTQMRSLGR